MYDYVTREFDLTPEEQEKARALRRLTKDVAMETFALKHFMDDFHREVLARLADPDQLYGAWDISQDDTKVIICQVKLVGKKK